MNAHVALMQYTTLMEQSAEVLQDGPINRTSKVSWRGEEFVVRRRLPNLKRTNQFFAAERYAYPLVSRSVRVPELMGTKISRKDRVAIFRFIAGKAPCWNEAGIRRQLLNVLSAIHSIVGPGVGPVGRPRRVLDYVTYFRKHYAREVTLFSRTAPMTKGEVLALRGYASRFDLFRRRIPTLCHGDIHPGNFIADSSGVLWTIDWEAARFRFPESDFNQMHVNWLSAAQQEEILLEYCAGNGYSVTDFRAGVELFRVLWHLRTYNFYVEGKGREPIEYAEHVSRVRGFLECGK